jgi:hypothetical protein
MVLAKKLESNYDRNIFEQLYEALEKVDKLQNEITEMKSSHRREIYTLNESHTKSLKTQEAPNQEKALKKALKEKKAVYENEIYLINAYCERSLREQKEKYMQEIRALKEKVTVQELEIARLSEENAGLRVIVGQNSGNSSKPPSSDGYKKIHNSRAPTGRKIGGQMGHGGYVPVFLGKPTKIVELKSTKCKCGGKIEYGDSSYTRKQLVDIEINTNITEYREYKGKCDCCGSSVLNRSPLHDSIAYGNNIKSLSAMLSVEGNVSINRIGQMISEITNGMLKLSGGTICKWQRDLSKLVAPSVEKIKEKLLVSSVLHKDETGVWVNKKLNWFHVLSNDKYSLFYANKRRGRDADIEAAVLPAFKGVLVHDNLKGLYHFACTHAECNAHILRYLKGVAENKKRKWAEEMIGFLMKAKSAAEENALESDKIQDFYCQYDEILNNGEFEIQQSENPEYKGADLTLLRRLREYKTQHLLFLSDSNVPFDNNQAERDLRMIKAKTKISGCFRSADGDSIFATLKSYTASLRKNAFNIFDGIISAWNARPVLF